MADLLLVGLGNPGSEYRATRHNIGAMVLDHLACVWQASAPLEKYRSLFCSARLGGDRIALLQPQTYMNRSGLAVAEYARFFKVDPQNIVVLHDDIDMAPGRIKLVRGGGAGGHNGIKSITADLGTPDYYRLKIGVGRPGKFGVDPRIPVEKYVLARFSPEQEQILDDRYDAIAEGLQIFCQENPAAAATRLNSLK